MKTISAEDIAESLQGTCKSLTEALEEHDAEKLEDDMAFCLEIDQLVFCCESCSWWSEMSEMSDESDMICVECDG